MQKEGRVKKQEFFSHVLPFLYLMFGSKVTTMIPT